MSHFTNFTGYVLFIITSFLASVESADQCLLNSKVLSCFSGVIMSIRSFFLYYELSVAEYLTDKYTLWLDFRTIDETPYTEQVGGWKTHWKDKLQIKKSAELVGALKVQGVH